MRTFRGLLLLCAAVACVESGRMQALAYTDFGQGRPIAAKDLAGKKFCWDGGGWTIYAADGHYTNSKGDHTHWSVPEPGVVEQTVRGSDRRSDSQLPILRCLPIPRQRFVGDAVQPIISPASQSDP